MKELDSIYRQYYEEVYRYLRGLTASEQIAEELTQEVFFRAIKGLKNFKGESKMSVWLCSIGKNLWYDKCRRDKKTIPLESPELIEADERDIADDIYRNKWDMSEDIFPENLDGLDVKEYKMVYYDPWDAQYLSYLTVQYDEQSYADEAASLAECGVTEYKGYYGVTGFFGGEPLAMNADSYQGFIYAINTPDA